MLVFRKAQRRRVISSRRRKCTAPHHCLLPANGFLYVLGETPEQMTRCGRRDGMNEKKCEVCKLHVAAKEHGVSAGWHTLVDNRWSDNKKLWFIDMFSKGFSSGVSDPGSISCPKTSFRVRSLEDRCSLNYPAAAVGAALCHRQADLCQAASLRRGSAAEPGQKLHLFGNQRVFHWSECFCPSSNFHQY